MAVSKSFKSLSLPSQLGKLTDYILNVLQSGEYNVYICSKRKNRSMPQNRYYWGVVLFVISKETGINPEELHEYFKHRFALKTEFHVEKNMAVTQAGLLVLNEISLKVQELSRPTKLMSTKDFTEYLDRIIVWASEKGMYIPKPNEIPEEHLIEMINNGL